MKGKNLAHLKSVVQRNLVVRLGRPNSCPYAELEVLDRQALEDKEFVLLPYSLSDGSDRHILDLCLRLFDDWA